MSEPDSGIFNAAHLEVELDLGDVHELSVRLLETLQGEDAALAVGAIALTLGRVLSPAMPMDPDDEVNFVQDLMQWAALYFVEGGSN